MKIKLTIIALVLLAVPAFADTKVINYSELQKEVADLQQTVKELTETDIVLNRRLMDSEANVKALTAIVNKLQFRVDKLEGPKEVD